MTTGTDQLKKDLIERVVERVHHRNDAERARWLDAFVRQFYRHVPPDDLLDDEPDNLYGRALAMYAFAQQRQPGQARVRVYNPDHEEHGYRTSHTIVEVVTDDMPFLVDSITSQLSEYEGQVHLVIHPMFVVTRGTNGRLTAIDAPDSDAVPGEDASGAERRTADAEPVRESFMQIAISEQAPERLPEVRRRLEGVLADVRAAVRDWRPMRDKMGALIDELRTAPPDLNQGEIDETLAFLEWANADNYTFLGYRRYTFEGEGDDAIAHIDPDAGLGVLRDPDYRIFEGLRNLGRLPADVRTFLHQHELLRITKANHRATVHRPVHMDTIAVKIFNDKRQVVGEHLFTGLFTSAAYSRSPTEIPLLRRKVDQVLAWSGFRRDSHNGKALLNILENYPRDELFQISDEDLYSIAMGILHLQERQRVALFMRRDAFERFVSCMVYVPRDHFSTTLRLRFQDILAKAFNGEVSAFYTNLTEAVLARVHIIVRTTPGEIPQVDKQALERRLADAARSWRDHLRDALVDDRGEQAGLAATRRFGDAFPASYQETFTPHTAVFDIARTERAIADGDLALNLYRPIEADEDEVRFKIYHYGGPIPLSRILPVLENMGVQVISEHPYAVQPADLDKSVYIHDFGMRVAGGHASDLSALKAKFHDVFDRVWHDRMENDGFNRLVLLAGLDSRDIIVLRAYCKYLRQAAIPFSQSYMEDTLAGNPGIAAQLVQLFHRRFDPAFQGDRDTACGETVAAVHAALEEVESLDQDRIVRRFLNAIEATQRTNFFQSADEGGEKPTLSLKIASREVDELPLPRPFREIFVYSPRVEAVHLRFGLVARGGLRWSDRREDFRTEILSLAKAQQVKNAVIVPVGSKGGFVCKRPPAASAGKQAMWDEGIACYKLFIRGMLDVTDNLVQDAVDPPTNVVRWDADDPYLVVAADKGTATFSDYANEVSQAYGFWMDDAFASGGSAGYDHKELAITARGAWESVKRHFRERGKDIQNEDFTVVGCGDMAGDVFGNGMLLSKHIRLVGAFNHIHIFVDPNPDAAASWQERKRLFDEVKGWDQYDTSKISKGGGVFERRAKSITLTPEIKKAFNIKADQCTPNELIRAMLLAKVELLWFGGIGTYIKASHETNAEVGDRANDPLRVNGEDLNATVIGEGANLGATQHGRIEFSLEGGRCNADFIDNSGGADCSDHEVNLKILLGAVEQAGEMTRKQRNQLLERMSEDVAQLVLRTNYLQTQALSVTEQLGVHLLNRNARFMHALERSGKLNRSLEALPDDETILERRKAGIGLMRPEMAVLMAYAKNVLYAELLASGLPDDPFMRGELHAYFPKAARSTYPAYVDSHRLWREIIATSMTNEVINRCGLAFVHEMRERTGNSPDAICRAYTVVREVFGLQALWDEIESLDTKVPAATQAAMMVEIGRTIERTATWFLRTREQPMAVQDAVDTYADGVGTVAGNLDALLTKDGRKHVDEKAREFTQKGAPKELARRVAALGILPTALDIVQTAHELDLPVQEVGTTYFAVGHRFGFDWLRTAANQLPTDNTWDKLAITAIVDDFYSHQTALTHNVLTKADGAGGAQAVDAWARTREHTVNRTHELLQEMQSTGTPDLAMLAVANRQMKSMVQG
ncbi:glutamate dehydrogenase (NAD) [Limimonas halophila]|uniref:Glutamate dehydrogenase (NAD) n=1 Tax=Limimonas halophila TaxID=1082479 RepID=A0A1G7RKF2_9PROT|nr:NAD-glutamate dehydrogenase [Limimonas halophila]SDG11154.1 glutamate dehydrogenase (NAD) [Limimonas halophila]